MSEWIIMLNDYPIGFVKATQEEIVKITRHLVEKKLLKMTLVIQELSTMSSNK